MKPSLVPEEPVYETIAAFAAGLVEHGVENVVISPGSRSTPLAVTLHAQPGLHTWIQIDERSAGFFALGQAKASGRPSVLVCTSGTAAANYLPAVVEAHHGGIPLIVCTADRPPELRAWGAGQTIDQVGIYGTATRWAVDLPVAGTPAWTPAKARLVAHRAVASACGSRQGAAGPVHLNWPLREPLEPKAAVPVHLAGDIVDPGLEARGAESLRGHPALAGITGDERGVIIVGPDAAAGIAAQCDVVEAAARLSASTGWPLIGEPISGVRRLASAGEHSSDAVLIAHAEQILKTPIGGANPALVPDLVIRVGGSPTTKPVRLWLERHQPRRVVLIDPAERWNDASFTLTDHLAVDPALALDALTAQVSRADVTSWSESWTQADQVAASAIGAVLDAGDDGLFGSARVVDQMTSIVPDGTIVMTSNSMPVRDLDSFVRAEGPQIDFVGNRGASGIDGITSTALGLASLSAAPVVLFIGDIALLHDLGALFGAARAGLRLTVVCVDNDGGAIFSMLPIADRAVGDDAIDFRTLFHTPHGLDLSGFDGIGGVRVVNASSEPAFVAELAKSLARETPGVDVIVVSVDADADIAQRRSVTAAVGNALDSREVTVDP